MTLSFMIKKKYLAEKVTEQEATGTFHERREYKPFWRKRMESLNGVLRGRDAMFLCGRHAFYADIKNITIDETPQGIEDVVGEVLCYNIECKFLPEEFEELKTFLAIGQRHDGQ